LVCDPAIREELEDLLDLEIAKERASEPTRPLRDFKFETTRQRRRRNASSTALNTCSQSDRIGAMPSSSMSRRTISVGETIPVGR
jgi:hypothetical protein